MKAVKQSRKTGLASVQKVCSSVRLNRDAYYKSKERLDAQKRTEAKVISLVKEERKIQSRVGTQKLQKHLATDFSRLGVKIGRDRFSIYYEPMTCLSGERRSLTRPPIHIIDFTSTII